MASLKHLCSTPPIPVCVRSGPYRSVRFWKASGTFLMVGFEISCHGCLLLYGIVTRWLFEQHSHHRSSTRGTMLGRVGALVLLTWEHKAEAAAQCLVLHTPRSALTLQVLKVDPAARPGSPSPLVYLNLCATIQGQTQIAPTKCQV